MHNTFYKWFQPKRHFTSMNIFTCWIALLSYYRRYQSSYSLINFITEAFVDLLSYYSIFLLSYYKMSPVVLLLRDCLLVILLPNTLLVVLLQDSSLGCLIYQFLACCPFQALILLVILLPIHILTVNAGTHSGSAIFTSHRSRAEYKAFIAFRSVLGRHYCLYSTLTPSTHRRSELFNTWTLYMTTERLYMPYP